MAKPACVYYRLIRSVKAGQLERFSVSYDPEPTSRPTPSLWLRVRNTHLVALRAAYLAGPYVLYVDCVSEDYDSRKQCFVSADQPLFAPQVSPGQSFCAELSCHTIKDTYRWTVDVVSQIMFNTTIDVEFEISISSDPLSPDTDLASVETSPSTISVGIHDTLDLWNLPLPNPTKPIHLVVLTHGLHSNVTSDMLYLKEQIDRGARQSGENVLVCGYFGNAGKTERGIKYLGSRVAEYVVLLVLPQGPWEGRVDRISFVGHSLGGLVQLFAIAYLHVNFPWFFTRIRPINFIALASPFLGVVHENPNFVKLALLAGIVGITGQDLGLKHGEHNSQPLLLVLPTGPTHVVLKQFARRTIYANAVNDGIVPLRTASLLYLDYRGLSQILGGTSTPSPANNVTSGQLPNGCREVDPKESSNACSTSTTDGANHSPLTLEAPTAPNNAAKIAKVPALLLVLSSIKAVRSLFAPQKQAENPSESTSTAYGRYQAGSSDDPGALEYGTLPRLSVLQSATSLLLPPLPPMKFVCDPAARGNVIVHDKVYDEADIPAPSREMNSSSPIIKTRLRLMESLDHDIEHLEDRIAREYHSGMAWRKVIVRLNPDAHNNIIVRRRFANAYGWPVIDHLVTNHFGGSADTKVESSLSTSLSAEKDETTDPDLLRLMDRDAVARDNENIDREQTLESDLPEHVLWMKAAGNAELIFALGPTGLLSEVSAMVGKAKDQWDNHGIAGVWGLWPLGSSPPSETASTSAQLRVYTQPRSPGAIEMDPHVMGDFM